QAGPAQGGAQQAPEVAVFTVTPQALAMSTELPGRTAAYQVAEVRPQVGGLIQKRLFTEGGDVKAGVQLYQIDAATYQAAYNSAKANLAKAKANLAAAAPKVARYKELVAIEGVSRQDYDDAVAAHEQAKAEVEAAQAAVDSARINVDYTKVASPISGRISRSNVTPGALVTAGQATALTTVQQLDPIYVDVTQSSEELLRLKRELDSGSLKRANGQAAVTLLLADGSKYALPGKLQFSDVSVDPGTGNVTLRALFPNPKHDLLPGMFVRAVLETGVSEQAIAVPQMGVTRNPKGEATALVLNKEGKVEQRVLQTGGIIGDKWLVKSGLAAGDRVIVEGLQKVKPGAPAVVAKNSSGSATTAAADKPAVAAR
ncbi:MAG TPA: efflux RND transporter periplasmic adaptor subunit, partial [Pseudoduganella sp.]